jgi:hypothetical protein
MSSESDFIDKHNLQMKRYGYAFISIILICVAVVGILMYSNHISYISCSISVIMIAVFFCMAGHLIYMCNERKNVSMKLLSDYRKKMVSEIQRNLLVAECE